MFQAVLWLAWFLLEIRIVDTIIQHEAYFYPDLILLLRVRLHNLCVIMWSSICKLRVSSSYRKAIWRCYMICTLKKDEEEHLNLWLVASKKTSPVKWKIQAKLLWTCVFYTISWRREIWDESVRTRPSSVSQIPHISRKTELTDRVSQKQGFKRKTVRNP